MKNLVPLLVAGALAGCAMPPAPPSQVSPEILGEVQKAGARKPQPPASALDEALLPPLRMELPAVAGRPLEPRFDLSVSNAPAQQVFLSLATGTRYNMLVHPSVSGTISIQLKDVTLEEALEAIRELYGYEYEKQGSRIVVRPAGLQTRVYRVNYLTGQRRGTSDVRVQSGSVSDVAAGVAPGAVPGAPGAAPAGGFPGAAPGLAPGIARALETSRVQTQQTSDFWAGLTKALEAIVGTEGGRGVVVTPHSGVVVVRAMPQELRAVEQYLRETRLAVERQVMLEAKIIEVTLADEYQAGINWAAFRNSGPNIALGQSSSATGTTQLATRGSTTPLAAGNQAVDTAARIAATAGSALAAANPATAIFGIALQTSNFAALLQFLQTQGSVQVLSSPRIAVLNNQKAVLKVGTDEFFVTNVSTTTTTTGTATQQTPSVTVAPFFSGIVLDVTPQIAEGGAIMLHVRPSVSEVTESRRVVDLGGTLPSINLPLAKSQVSETDTIVRATDGNIVAIGGLMSLDVRDSRGGLPGGPDPLRNANRQTRKKELVILIKPTVIWGDRDWEADLRETGERLRGFYPPREEREGARQ
ncbi:MAG: secretin N-terminal domain-containing protein [Pseudomonadota bacterium]